MINGSTKIYTITEIKSMTKESWPDDFRNYFNTAPRNVQRSILSFFSTLDEDSQPETNDNPHNHDSAINVPKDQIISLITALKKIESKTFDTNHIDTIIAPVILDDSTPLYNQQSTTDLPKERIALLATVLKEVANKLSETNQNNTKILGDIPENNTVSSNTNNESLTILEEKVHSSVPAEETSLPKEKPVSSLTFFFKPTPQNKTKKKNQFHSRPLLLNIYDGYECPSCNNTLFIANIVIQFGAKSEVKFPVDYCKRCNKYHISREKLQEILPLIENKPNFEYSILDLEENPHEEIS